MAMAAPTSSENLKEKRSKWRLSNLLSPHQKDNATQQEEEQHVSDSAYGGSDTSNSSAAASAQNVPTISKSEATAQGAPVKTSIDATGRTITTTTTTTTTTVTTTNGDHFQVPPGREVVVTKDETTTEGPTELSARPASRNSRKEQQGPPIPVKDKRRSDSPGRPNSLLPGEPSSHNFSYPARTPPLHSPFSPAAQNPHPYGVETPIPQQPQQLQQPQQPQKPQKPQQYQAYRPPQNTSRPRPPVEPSLGQPRLNGQPPRNNLPHPVQQRPSTVQNIKTAAAGIHGAGETLRGTLNSTIDRRLGAAPESIAAHDAVADRGRMEIETGQFHRPPAPAPEEHNLEVPQDKGKKPRGFRNVLRKSKEGLKPVDE